MSTSSRTSQRQPSPSLPAQSMTQCDISLDTLVSHLLAAKLSLASYDAVSRAKEIVISARRALEDCAVVTARTSFLQKGISQQMQTLRKFRTGITVIYDNCQKEFKNVIWALDSANERLEATMETLRSTLVEAAFRPEDEEPRCLLDFVDEQGVETLRDTLKENIRKAKAAQTEFDSAILSYDDDLNALKTSLITPLTARSISEQSLITPYHLRSLESHAQQMVDLLESLIKHFDLCVTAIRNTEGGTAAVRKATLSQHLGEDVLSVSGVRTPDNLLVDEEPISDEDLQEILGILEKDAAQVDDAVMELQGLLADMEIKHQAILDLVASLNTAYEKTTRAYQMLELVGLRLRGYIFASHDFRIRWYETKSKIHSQLSELESIRLFYESYYNSYDSLILEVHRRKLCQDRAQNILNKASDELNRIYQSDFREREEFCADVGEYLPLDLWPGISDVAPHWKFIRVDSGNNNQIPSMSPGVVERAAKRTRQRQMAEVRIGFLERNDQNSV
ncbi:Autophagy-related protein 17 [Golovinomyces cichoracearum]|uniref:Autophagy-related protein 17 n=1 Tax=Golovinomyces cichoracearum TaxID=62708 RepID=A0A420IN60_9PEZI|nr:Autophagy-related protein 17 [Golovinomyces cichoracearum]